MKHKHYDMIVAKAKNMDLVLFSNSTGHNYGKWSECNRETMPKDNGNINYFLCLPKHKEAVLEKLNGGECQYLPPVDGVREWKDSDNFQFDKWADVWWYMHDSFESRIKPKKEKRWIAVDASTSQCTRHYSTKESCFNSEFAGCEGNASGWQFIEIEVEVI